MSQVLTIVLLLVSKQVGAKMREEPWWCAWEGHSGPGQGRGEGGSMQVFSVVEGEGNGLGIWLISL